MEIKMWKNALLQQVWDKNDNVIKKGDVVNSIWERNYGEFYTDASMYERSDQICPSCDRSLEVTHFRAQRDDENEVTCHTAIHDCGAKLVIFND
jgi:formamidopyrimidine-DNA glycosylase